MYLCLSKDIYCEKSQKGHITEISLSSRARKGKWKTKWDSLGLFLVWWRRQRMPNTESLSSCFLFCLLQIHLWEGNIKISHNLLTLILHKAYFILIRSLLRFNSYRNRTSTSSYRLYKVNCWMFKMKWLTCTGWTDPHDLQNGKTNERWTCVGKWVLAI